MNNHKSTQERKAALMREVPWLQWMLGGYMSPPPLAEGAEPDEIADDVRSRVVEAVVRDVAAKEWHSEAWHEHIQRVLSQRLRQHMREKHSRITREPHEKRRPMLVDICAVVAEESQQPLIDWLRDHLGEGLREQLAVALREQFDEVLRDRGVRERLGVVGLDGQQPDRLLVLREHVIDRLQRNLGAEAGQAIAQAIGAEVKPLVMARLKRALAEIPFGPENEQRMPPEAFDEFAVELARRGSNALDERLGGELKKFLESRLDGTVDVFREELRKLTAMPPPFLGRPAMAPIGGAIGPDEIMRTVEKRFTSLLSDRLDEITRERMAPLLRERIREALDVALAATPFGIDLGIDDEDLDGIVDDIWERWGYDFRQQLGQWLEQRIHGRMRTQLWEAVQAALSPTVLELAAGSSGVSSGSGGKRSRYSVF